MNNNELQQHNTLKTEILTILNKYKESRDNSNQTPSNPPVGEICSACFGNIEGTLLKCRVCNNYVHPFCYYGSKLPLIHDEFTCEGCINKETGKKRKCGLCKKLEGILICIGIEKKKMKKWVHLSCVIWSNGLRFSNDMSIVIGEWTNMRKRYYKDECIVCKSNVGRKLKVCK